MRKYRPLIWCAVAMMALTAALSFWVFGGWYKKEIFFSWFLNLFNAYLFAAISRNAVGRDLIPFLAWAFLGHGLRFLAVLIAAGIAILAGWAHQTVLIVFILTGYLIFTVGEVIVLLRLNE